MHTAVSGLAPTVPINNLRKARVIRDLAPLRENYLTRTSPTAAQLLPTPNQQTSALPSITASTRRVFSRLHQHINFPRFSTTKTSIKMTGGGKSGGKASGSKNAQS
jgi:hypothetical protein